MRPAETVVERVQKRVQNELLSFPARLLIDLPEGVRFTVHGLGITGEVVLSTSKFLVPPGASASARLTFSGEELRAIAIGVQAERLSHADLKGYCLLKLHDPGFRVTERIALNGAQPADEAAWTLGRVLQRLELQLATVEFENAGGLGNGSSNGSSSASSNGSGTESDHESGNEPDGRAARNRQTDVRRSVGAAA